MMIIHPDAIIGENVTMTGYCEVGPDAVIGDDCQLHSCTVEGVIGDRVKVWRYAHVMKDAWVGNDSQVCNGAIVLTDSIIGERCDIQLWVGIARKARIGNDVYIGPNVVFCNAKYPGRTCSHDDLWPIYVEDGVSIGANCSIMYGVTIAEGAKVGAGSVVTRNIPAGETWVGVPAKRIK